MTKSLDAKNQIADLNRRLISSSPESPDFEILQEISSICRRTGESFSSLTSPDYKTAVDFLEAIERGDVYAATALRHCFAGGTSEITEGKLREIQRQARFEIQFKSLLQIIESLKSDESSQKSAKSLREMLGKISESAYIPPQFISRIPVNQTDANPISPLDLRIDNLKNHDSIDELRSLRGSIARITENPHSSLPPELQSKYEENVAEFLRRALNSHNLSEENEDFVIDELKFRGMEVPEELNRRHWLRLVEWIESDIDILEDCDLPAYEIFDSQFLRNISMLSLENSPEAKEFKSRIQKGIVLKIQLETKKAKKYLDSGEIEYQSQAYERLRDLKDDINKYQGLGYKIPAKILGELEKIYQGLISECLDYLDFDENEFIYEILTNLILSGKRIPKKKKEQFIENILFSLSYAKSDEEKESYFELLAEFGVSKSDPRVFEALHNDKFESIDNTRTEVKQNVDAILKKLQGTIDDLAGSDFPIPKDLQSMLKDFRSLVKKHKLDHD